MSVVSRRRPSPSARSPVDTTRAASGPVRRPYVSAPVNIAAEPAAIREGMHLLHAGPPLPWALLAGGGTTAMVVTGSFETIARVFKVLCVALPAGGAGP